VAVAWALVAGFVLAPTAALADRFRARPVDGGRLGDPVVARPSVSQGIGRPPFSRRPFFHRPVIPFVAAPIVLYAFPPPLFYSAPAPSDPPVIYNSTVVYSSPAAYSSPAVYSSPPAVYDLPAVYRAPVTGAMSPPPAPPETPSVIEYSTGRYELRGDGVTVLYTWVWIPNPPPPPPDSAGRAPAPLAPPGADDPVPGRQSQLFRWTDAQGAMHWTNRADAVPEEHRSQAKSPATGGR
jgi:hypothetical protein